MGNTPECCYRRESEEPVRASRCESWHSLPDAEELWSFEEFECSASDSGEESFKDVASDSKRRGTIERIMMPVRKSIMRVEKSRTYVRLRSDSRPLELVPEEAIADMERQQAARFNPPVMAENAKWSHLVPHVKKRVRQVWEERLANPDKLNERVSALIDVGFPELDEWTTDGTCLRMLRATQGDEATAINMLAQAIDCRVRHRILFKTLVCDVQCDIRIIGRDFEQRPAVYMCCRNQKKTLKECVPQVLLAFEAAVRLGEGMGNGQLVFVADMHLFSPSLNMDPFVLKEIGACFGTVFADRFAFILIVDFSVLAQSLWYMCKPLISDRTQKKINFVGIKEARVIAKEKFAPPTCERILSAFDINREKRTTDDERDALARRTAICDVPLGQIRQVEPAG